MLSSAEQRRKSLGTDPNTSNIRASPPSASVVAGRPPHDTPTPSSASRDADGLPASPKVPLYIAAKPGSLEVMGFGRSIGRARQDAARAILQESRTGRTSRIGLAEAHVQADDLLVFRLVSGTP